MLWQLGATLEEGGSLSLSPVQSPSYTSPPAAIRLKNKKMVVVKGWVEM